MKSMTMACMALFAFSCATAAEAKLYEKRVVLQCSTNTCSGLGKAVPPGKALWLSTISCYTEFSVAASAGVGIVSLDATGLAYSQAFRADAAAGRFTIAPVQPVPMRVPSGKKLSLQMSFDAGTTTAGTCYLRGTMN